MGDFGLQQSLQCCVIGYDVIMGGRVGRHADRTQGLHDPLHSTPQLAVLDRGCVEQFWMFACRVGVGAFAVRLAVSQGFFVPVEPASPFRV